MVARDTLGPHVCGLGQNAYLTEYLTAVAGGHKQIGIDEYVP